MDFVLEEGELLSMSDLEQYLLPNQHVICLDNAPILEEAFIANLDHFWLLRGENR